MLVAGISSAQLAVAISFVGLCIVIYTTVTKSRKEAKHQKAKAAKDAAVAEGRDKTAMEEVADLAKRAVSILEGGPPTWDNPKPKGLVTMVLEQGRILDTHTKILKELTPNGGNTNSPGDILWRAGETLGVIVPEEPHDTD